MNDIAKTPARDLGWGLLNDFDDLFQGFFRPARMAGATGAALVPAVDIVEHDNEYVVKAELPGVKKDDIDITIQDNVLTINAETKSETEEKEGGRVIRQERQYGKFVRSMRLGAQVDASKVKAQYKDGVLTLTLPKAEEVRPKKIAVEVA